MEATNSVESLNKINHLIETTLERVKGSSTVSLFKSSAILDFTIFSESCINNQTLTTEILLELASVFGGTAQTALDLLDRRSITEVKSSTSERVLYQIRGSTGLTYTILPEVNRCPCPFWMENVWENNVEITCKHVLATRLAVKLTENASQEASDQQLQPSAKKPLKIPCYLNNRSVDEEIFVQMIANMD